MDRLREIFVATARASRRSWGANSSRRKSWGANSRRRRSRSARPSRRRTCHGRASTSRNTGQSYLTLLGCCGQESGHVLYSNVVFGSGPGHHISGVVVPAKAKMSHRKLPEPGGVAIATILLAHQGYGLFVDGTRSMLIVGSRGALEARISSYVRRKED